jgi:hypothetical protein
MNVPKKKRKRSAESSPKNVIGIFKSLVEELSGATKRWAESLDKPTKTTKVRNEHVQILRQDKGYEVGAMVDVDWPLTDGSTSWYKAVIVDRECRPRKRKRAKVSAFRYKLEWNDGSTPCWSRLLHLPHEVHTSSVGAKKQKIGSRVGSHRSLTISAEFKAAHGVYVEANGSIAWVPDKLVKCMGDDPKHSAWLTLKQQAKQFRLAYRYQKLPQEDFEQLKGIGFAWCKNEEKWEKVVVPALLTYKEVHGDLEVPQQFEVPPSKPWPEHLWGMKLGTTVSQIRSSETYVRNDPERRQWLDSKGFEWDDLERQWESTQEAFETYLQEHGDLAVKTSFVVPSCSPWAEKLWGMKLGTTVDHIRSSGTFVAGKPERKQWLEARGFQFETAVVDNTENDRSWENQVVPALLTYKKVRGDLEVPRPFEVPPSEPWPEHLWGMKLGSMVSQIRSSEYYVRNDPERRQWLDSKGFEWDEFKRQWEITQEAFETYLQEHGDLAVKRSFVVPSCSPWAKKLWGMALGNTVHGIRSQGNFMDGTPERKQWLEARGFLFKVNQSSAEQVRLAAAHYGRQRIGATSGTAGGSTE